MCEGLWSGHPAAWASCRRMPARLAVASACGWAQSERFGPDVGGVSDERARRVVRDLHRALNDHDIDRFVALFDDDYDSFQPLRPTEAFRGSAQVRKNWSAIFEAMPDFRGELLREVVEDATAWTEWEMTATKPDGSELIMRGVIIMGIPNDKIAWARLYIEPVFAYEGDIEQGVRDMIE